MSDRNMVVDVTGVNGESIKQIAPAIKFNGQLSNMFVTEPNILDTTKILSHFGYNTRETSELTNNNILK